MKAKILTLGIAASLLSVTALALVAQDFTMKYKREKGNVSKFKLTGTIDVQGQSVGISATVIEKVVKVDEDGSVTLSQTQENTKISVGGQEMEPPAQEASTEVRKASGELIETKGGQDVETSFRTGQLSNLVVPGKAIKVGDSWEHVVKADAKKGSVDAKMTYKLLAEEKMGKFDCFKIKMNGIETGGTTPAAMESTAWVSKDALVMVKVESKWINVPIAGAGAVNGNIKLELLP